MNTFIDPPTSLTVRIPAIYDYLDGMAFVFADGAWVQLHWVQSPELLDDSVVAETIRQFQAPR